MNILNQMKKIKIKMKAKKIIMKIKTKIKKMVKKIKIKVKNRID
jgi:hypothetical protein